MIVTKLELSGALRFSPKIFRDDRGSFLESWQEQRYLAAGVTGHFVQDNTSVSRRGVLRGLHLQSPKPQGKLVSVLQGAVFDVLVDLRKGSPTFGRWVGQALDATSREQVWVPTGFAHGFYVTSDEATVCYKCTEYYAPAAELTIRWDDPELGITWPLAGAPILSPKDAAGLRLKDVPVDRLVTP